MFDLSKMPIIGECPVQKHYQIQSFLAWELPPDQCGFAACEVMLEGDPLIVNASNWFIDRALPSIKGSISLLTIALNVTAQERFNLDRGYPFSLSGAADPILFTKHSFYHYVITNWHFLFQMPISNASQLYNGRFKFTTSANTHRFVMGNNNGFRRFGRII